MAVRDKTAAPSVFAAPSLFRRGFQPFPGRCHRLRHFLIALGVGMFVSLGQKLGLDRAALGHGLRLAFSAWLAFTIAASLHVHNAFWAAMPIWVVAQSSRGLLLERAFFRIVGTLIGAALGFGILYLSDNAYLQLALLGCVVAVGGGLTHLLRGVHSYAAMMAGMTAAVVLLPSVLTPQNSSELAIARVECTLIGVVVVTLVMGWFTPGSRRDLFYQRVRELGGDAVAFAAQAIALREVTQLGLLERRILAEMSDVEAAASMVSAGSLEGYRRLHHVNALVAASLSVMAGGRAVRARCRRGEIPPRGLAEQLEVFARQLKEERRGTPASFVWQGTAATPELKRLLDTLNQLTDAEQSLFAESSRADAKSFSRKASYLAPYRDWILARRTGLVAGTGTFAAGLIAYLWGHPGAELAALGVCIFSLVLGSMPTPQKIAPYLFTGVVVGVIAATFYRFVIQPGIATQAQLIWSVFPFILVGGLARASSRTAIPALDANMCFMLASQAGMPAAGAGEIVGGALAMLVGAGVVSGGFWLIPRQSKRHALDAAQAIRRDLERLIRQAGEKKRREWHPRSARQILRLMLHISRAGKLGTDAPDGLLAAFNLGHALAALREAAWRPEQRAEVRQSIAEVFRVSAAFADEPQAVSAELSRQARHVDDDDVRRAIEMAADAIRGGEAFFRFSSGRDGAAVSLGQ